MARSSRRKTPATFPGVRGYYVPSTHWDREWYEPFQHYRFRLLDVLGDLLDLLERDPDYRAFLLDGQTSVLDDYLEIRPEDQDRIAALVKHDRLQIGPWYVMPDEFLPSGESLVRNLMLGHQTAARFGPVFKCGFVSDIFGHNSQLPQILAGFGIDTAVIWRGASFTPDRGLLHWQAADGKSQVLAYIFEPRGYGQVFFEVRMPSRRPGGGFDIERGIEGIRRCYELEHDRTPGKAVLLFDSMDHQPAVPQTTALLRAAREAGFDIRHATLGEFLADVRRQRLDLPVERGEMRHSGRIRDGHVIPGVLSSRIHLKQDNARCESLLTRWAEPFGALARHLGAPLPDATLRVAWRHLLLNHPHDSICGCSIDQVHQDMQYRFDQARMIAERYAHMALRAVADRTPLPKLSGDEDYAVTVFNPTGAEIDEVVELPLLFNRDTENRFQEWFGYEPIIGFRLFDEHGREIPYQRLEVTKLRPYKTYDRLAGHHNAKCEEVRVAARLRIPPVGWTTLLCSPTKDRTRSSGTQRLDDRTMENEHLRVRINANGTLDITDRKARHTYRDVLTFEERADIGDGWYHGTAVNDEVFTSTGAAADIALIHDGFAQTTFRIRITMHVPEHFVMDPRIMRRSDGLAPLVITSWVTLRAGVPWLDVRTEVDNTIRDHRLRVMIPTHIRAKTYFADSPFDVVERPIALAPDAHRLFEPELETKPQYSFTAVNDGNIGLAVIASGQPESAVCDLPERPIALTLFRGFGRTVAQEGELGGQLLGKTSHRYWIYPHRGALPTADLCRMGTRLAAGLELIFTERDRLAHKLPKPVLEATDSWIKPGPGPLVITACKVSEDRKAVILRLFNPTTRAARQRFEFRAPIQSAHATDLLEKPQRVLAARTRSISVSAGAKQIVTLRVRLKTIR